MGITNNNPNKTDYFRSSANRQAYEEDSRLITQKFTLNLVMHLQGAFKLLVREGSHLYQAPPRRLVYALQEPLKDVPDRLLTLQIIVSLDVDEMSEWCNSFVLVPKANDKVQLCLDPARLNSILIRPVHRDVTLNDILPRLAGIK